MTQLVMYRKFTENLIEKTNYSFNLIDFHYLKDGKRKEIAMKNLGYLYYPNEKVTLWNPKDNNIEIQFRFEISNIHCLFDEKGVADEQTTLAVGLHAFSKDSRFQQYYYVADIQKDMESLNEVYHLFFEKCELRGTIFFESFLYVKEVPLIHDQKKYFSYTPGAVLSDNSLPIFELNVDGQEQIFPIHEFHDKNGPMWQLQKYYANPAENPFTSETIQLLLNKDHELFDKIVDPKSRAFKHHLVNILLEVMSLITYDVISSESINLDDPYTYDTDSIAEVVRYWVETYDITVALDADPTIIDIRNQFQKNAEQSLVEFLETEDRND